MMAAIDSLPLVSEPGLDWTASTDIALLSCKLAEERLHRDEQPLKNP
jgi:hypothetical protein